MAGTYRGVPAILYANGKWLILDGLRRSATLEDSRATRRLIHRLFPAFANEQELVRQVKEHSARPAKARARRKAVVRDIVLEAVAWAAESGQRLTGGYVKAITAKANQEITRRRKNDPQCLEEDTPRGDSVSEEYVRRTLKAACNRSESKRH